VDDKPDADDRTQAASGYPRTAAAPPPDANALEGGDKLPVGTRLGEFEVTGLVGEGGFSVVYLAWDHSLERRVALKEYLPSSLATRKGQSQVHARSERHRETFELGLKSFINEGKLLAQFDHAALVKVYRFWEANGTAYMVMPLYEGTTLKDNVRALGAPPDEAWLRGLLDPLTEALTVIHREQCFHRDIAPDNVLLLANSGKPLLLDFGAARRVIGDKTQALTVILKPGYAPIEQYAEDLSMKQGAWTDVYALAAVVYWCITGKTPPVAVGRMLSDGYVPLAQCAAGRYSGAFLAAVDRALAVLPDHRTRSIEQLRSELQLGAQRVRDEKTVMWDPGATVVMPPAPAAASRPPVPPPASTPTPQHRPAYETPEPAPAPATSAAPPRRVRLASALAVVGVLLAGGIAWWALQPTAPAPPPTASIDPARPSAPAAEPRPPVATPPSAEPTPRPVQTALERWLAGRDAAIEVSASAQPPAPGAPAAMLRVNYRASEAGHAYVVGVAQDNQQLTLYHPAVGATPRRAAASGSLDVPAAALEDGASKLIVVLTRSPREPQTAGWFARDRHRVLQTAPAVNPGDATDLLGAPQCPRTAGARCDGAYGMTEVTSVTNVISAPPTPTVPPSGSPDGAPPAPPGPQTDRAEPRKTAPSTEGKTVPRPQPADAAECAQLLQRASLGETSQALIDRMKTLRCN
jgi:serine/threonine protein kinase